jgi:hypothetical protein
MRHLLLCSLLCLFICLRGFAQTATPKKNDSLPEPKWSFGINLLSYFYQPDSLVRYQLTLRRHLKRNLILRANVGFSGLDYTIIQRASVQYDPQIGRINTLLIGIGIERQVKYKEVFIFYGVEGMVENSSWKFNYYSYYNLPSPSTEIIRVNITQTNSTINVGMVGILGLRVPVFKHMSFTLESKLRALYADEQISNEVPIGTPTNLLQSAAFHRNSLHIDFRPSVQINFNF